MLSALMTPSLLLIELKKEFEEATKTTLLGDAQRAPGIFIGYLPMKQAQVPDPAIPVSQLINVESEDDHYPYIIVKYLRSEDVVNDDEELATTNIKIMFGVKTTDVQGYLDIMRLQEIVRMTLLKKCVIGGAAEIQRPLSMDVPEELQSYPYWYGEGTVSFIIPTILREVNFNDDF